MITMEKVESVKIDSWEPSEEHKFRYPRGREDTEADKELTPKLIKALEEGLGDSLDILRNGC